MHRTAMACRFEIRLPAADDSSVDLPVLPARPNPLPDVYPDDGPRSD